MLRNYGTVDPGLFMLRNCEAVASVVKHAMYIFVNCGTVDPRLIYAS